jgi:predicted dehydrogenase
MTIRVGLVGCGFIGAKRVAALPRDEAELVAVTDVSRDAAEALAARSADCPRVATDVDELLKIGDVELVVVATDHASLASIAATCAASGVHVLIEKPGADRLEPLENLRDVAAANGVEVRVGYNHRFHPAALLARELLAGRADEHLLYIRARYGHGGRVGYEREWRADRKRSGGGELIDQGAHLIDLVRFLVGEVDLAFGEVRTDFWAMDVEDNAYLALRPRRGGFAWLHASWTEWKNLYSLELATTRTKIEWNGLGGSYGPERLTLYEMSPEMGPPPSTAWEWPPDDRSWTREIEDVLKAIRGEPTIGASIHDAVAVMKIVEEVYRS